jgi:DNA-binding transcriptional LysR family regulator
MVTTLRVRTPPCEVPIVTLLCSARMTVEIRHLRAFLAIAEESSLTRAAVRLHMSQPALSRTLAQLERDLGVRLADRSTHHLELTAAGRHFERLAFDAVRGFEVAIAGAAGREVPIRLGHSWSAGIHVAAVLRRWGELTRTCSLEVVRNDDRTAGLTSGSVDAAMTGGAFELW